METASHQHFTEHGLKDEIQVFTDAQTPRPTFRLHSSSSIGTIATDRMTPYGLPQLLWVGLGGFLGTIGRFAMAGMFNRFSPILGFPVGTLTVNVLGCFLIGLLNGLAETRSLLGPDIRIFLFIGVLGGFTTYSTFGFESLDLLKDGAILKASANIILHVLLGLSAVWIGDTLGRL